MKTGQKVIGLLLKEQKAMTIRELSKKIKADYRITYTAVQRLVEKGVVNIQVVGGSSLCSLNKKYYGFEIYNAEDERKKRLFKNRNINQLFKELNRKIDSSFFILLVFGSYAKGKQGKNSDIDLMFISNEKGFEEKVDGVLSLLPLETHALVFSEKEFRRMLESKDFNVVKEAIGNYVLLYGIESFYRLRREND